MNKFTLTEAAYSRLAGCHGTLQHAPVGRLRYGVDMWRHLMPLLPTIHLYDGFCIDGQVLIGVDHHTKQAGVCLWDTSTRIQTVSDNHVLYM